MKFDAFAFSPVATAAEHAGLDEAVAKPAVLRDGRLDRPRRKLTVVRAALRQRAAAPVVAAQPAAVVAVDPRLERLLDALADATEPVYRAVAAALDLARFRNHADIGGGNGRLSCIFAAREPRLLSRSCDLPEIRAAAERRIRERGLAARVRAEALDPYAAEFPQADLITLGHLLHDWNVQRRKLLIAKAWRALAPDGALVAIETVAEPARRCEAARVEPSPGVCVELGDALDFTGTDFMQWIRDAGFRCVEVLALAGGPRAVVAFK